MLANKTFAVMKKKAIKTAKFMTKEQACFLYQTPIKFYNNLIQLMSDEDITLSPETWVGGISLIKDHEASTISSREVVRNNLSLKKHYIAQQARRAYLVSIYQLKALFDLFYSIQLTKFSWNDTIALNK